MRHRGGTDAKVACWQERLEPLNKKVFGGCHLTRTIADDVEHAGFRIEQLDTCAVSAPR